MILGMILLLCGAASGVGRMLLFSELKRRYPSQYALIGAPSVFFQNLDPTIPLGLIRGQIDPLDFKRFQRLKWLIHGGEAVLLVAIVAFVARGLA